MAVPSPSQSQKVTRKGQTERKPATKRRPSKTAVANVSDLQRQRTNVNDEFSSSVWDSLTEYAVFTITTNGEIATWNAGAVRTFGYDRSEAVGRDFSIIFTAADVADRLPKLELKKALAEGRVDRDCLHVRKNGSQFWATNTVQPLHDSDGKLIGFTKIVRDSTDRYEAVVAVRESEERFRLLVESVTDYAIFSTGPDGIVTLWNTGAERTFGYSSEELVGDSFTKLYVPVDIARGIPQRELSLARKHGHFENDGLQARKDGSHFMASRRFTLLRSESGGKAAGFAATVHDVTAQRASERQMWDKAFHDSLTGLPNRALLVDHLQRLLCRTKRHPLEHFALLFLDLVGFKTVNDDFGHNEGDIVLKEVARRILSCARPEDIIARMGGDEFTILLDDIGSAAAAHSFAKRVHAALAGPFRIQGADRTVGASIGIALGNSTYSMAADVLRDADSAMYEAKLRGGLEQTVLFDDGLRERGLSRHQLENDLRRAIARDELFLKYQPIVALDDLRVIGFEALLRWRHPQRGVIPPCDFIPIAESTGEIVQIDRWVIREACRQVGSWRNEFQAASMTISVNVSSNQFEHEDLTTFVQGILAESRLPAESLHIEITESAVLETSAVVLATLAALRALGVGIHVDDFGTGYSSLSYLSRFPLSGIKIDRSFVTAVDQDGDEAKILRAIIALARDLQLTVVAEGVETPDQLQALRTMSCESAQGYLFDEPLEAQAARETVAGRFSNAAIASAKTSGLTPALVALRENGVVGRSV